MAELGEWAPFRFICRGLGYGAHDKKVSANLSRRYQKLLRSI